MSCGLAGLAVVSYAFPRWILAYCDGPVSPPLTLAADGGPVHLPISAGQAVHNHHGMDGRAWCRPAPLQGPALPTRMRARAAVQSPVWWMHRQERCMSVWGAECWTLPGSDDSRSVLCCDGYNTG